MRLGPIRLTPFILTLAVYTRVPKETTEPTPTNNVGRLQGFQVPQPTEWPFVLDEDNQ